MESAGRAALDLRFFLFLRSDTNGPFPCVTIDIPSAISASNSEGIEVNGISTTTHKLFWTEQRASLNAYYYFNKYYGIKITDFKHYLPYHQPQNK